MFVTRKVKWPPFCANTRIYSCNLIRTGLPFRWRGRFNEDTILSLDLLTAGWCTVQFNAFLQEKTTTMTMKGGNTDTIYVDGTLAKSAMLVDTYPQFARHKVRWGRDHHFVDYGPFKNQKLIPRPGLVLPADVDEFGMALATADEARARGQFTGAELGRKKRA